jgi:dTDP-4-amino-4,6-dideoxygalactose transaminase
MIPFRDLRAQYQSIKSEIDRAVASVLESGQYVLGGEVSAFEKEFAAYCGAPEAVAVNSGTSALHLALLAAGIGPGDEVITVPFTFVATVAAIRYTGAKPVFVDIEVDSYTLDVSRLDKAITRRTRAILPVHLYGQPADMDPILEIARRHDLLVIEDAAQAPGARCRNRRVGTLGDMACFSFEAGNNLGACGEGGAVVTRNSAFARKIRMLRDWGGEKKHEHVLPGYNYRMESMQAAILRVKLRHLDDWTSLRRAHAARYCEELAGSGLHLPAEMPYAQHAYHVFAIESAARERLQRHLTAYHIQTDIHYPYAIHLTPANGDLGFKRGDFPAAEHAASRVLSLPIYPEMDPEAPRRVASAVRSFASMQARSFQPIGEVQVLTSGAPGQSTGAE